MSRWASPSRACWRWRADAALGKALGVSVQSVAKWDRRIPSQHAQGGGTGGLAVEIVRPDMVQRGHNEAEYVNAAGK